MENFRHKLNDYAKYMDDLSARFDAVSNEKLILLKQQLKTELQEKYAIKFEEIKKFTEQSKKDTMKIFLASMEDAKNIKHENLRKRSEQSAQTALEYGLEIAQNNIDKFIQNFKNENPL